MDSFTKNPGLFHISEKIFKFLDQNSLMDCRMVNKSWKQVLDQPIFWLKKLNSNTDIVSKDKFRLNVVCRQISIFLEDSVAFVYRLRGL